MSTQRTAQELADECKGLAYEHADWVAAHAVDFGYQGDKVVPDYGGCPEVLTSRGALHAAIDRLAALASQAEPVGEVDDRAPYRVKWAKDAHNRMTHGMRLYTTPPAPAQAEQSEDGRDAEHARFYRWLKSRAVKHTAYDVYGDGCHWSIGFVSEDSSLDLDAAIAAKEQS